MGRLRSGVHQFAVRWNTVRCTASEAISWMTCTAVGPVPMIPTFFPVRSISSFGQRAVCRDMPWKSSTPS